MNKKKNQVNFFTHPSTPFRVFEPSEISESNLKRCQHLVQNLVIFFQWNIALCCVLNWYIYFFNWKKPDGKENIKMKLSQKKPYKCSYERFFFSKSFLIEDFIKCGIKIYAWISKNICNIFKGNIKQHLFSFA